MDHSEFLRLPSPHFLYPIVGLYYQTWNRDFLSPLNYWAPHAKRLALHSSLPPNSCPYSPPPTIGLPISLSLGPPSAFILLLTQMPATPIPQLLTYLHGCPTLTPLDPALGPLLSLQLPPLGSPWLLASVPSSLPWLGPALISLGTRLPLSGAA